MHTVYFLLGSNLGDCTLNLKQAVEEISKHIGLLLKVSSVYKSAPWGFDSSHEFLNQVVCAETALSPEALLKNTQAIEKRMGRVKTRDTYEERLIDIDILFYDDTIVEENHLKVPHPLLAYRRFTLIPLQEIAPNLKHPVTQLTISEILENCTDPSEVTQYS
ncbi:MAG: Bifunctional folate synthesis protein [Bacteroidetes bacterium ADurb.Bin408]|nr:MAG: Bifunctional folate synthesis protein [Bacteroidetes bacterium ADurb.Bin408]